MIISALKNNDQTISPVLIVDKVGVIGEAIAIHFSKESSVVLLSEKLFTKENKNIIHIPFKGKIPQAPDNEYSKIFIIDDGTSVTRESAFSFINKALENSAPLYFIGSIRNLDVEHSDDITNSYKNAKILLFGDLFDDNINFDKNSSVNEYISSVRKGLKIDVAGDGMSFSYPITFSDTIKLIIKATELEIEQKSILLFSGRPVTDLSLANIFKNINSDVEIEFTKKNKKAKTYIPEGSMHALDRYDLEDKIKKINLTRVGKAGLKTPKNKTLKRRFPLLYLLFTVFIVVLTPFITTFSLLYLGYASLGRIEKSYVLGELQDARKYSRHSAFIFNLSEKSTFVLAKELSLIRSNKLLGEINRQVKTGRYLSEASIEIANSFIGIDEIYSGKTSSPRDVFYTSSNSFKNGMSLIEKSKSYGKYPKNIDAVFKNLNPISDLLINSPEVVLTSLGFEEEKKYLIVELNNKNVKPIGGAIGRMKLVFIKNGKIISSKEVSSKELDDNDYESSNIPFFAKRYLNIKTLTIENSVYKNSFINNATDIMNIYLSKNSQALDGVIGVTSDFFDKPRDKSPFNLISLLGEGITTKNILISVSDADAGRVYETKNWSGTIVDNRVKSKKTLNDFLGIIESNVGEVDILDISRSVSKTVFLNTNGVVSSSVTLAIKNNGGSNYKNYVQLQLPIGSTLSEIKIDDTKQKIVDAVTEQAVFGAKRFKAPNGFEVYQAEESGKELVGFLIEVPNESVRTITISYELPYLLNKENSTIDYSLHLNKQPGILGYNFNLNFDIPSIFQIINSRKNIELNLDRDHKVSATISNK